MKVDNTTMIVKQIITDVITGETIEMEERLNSRQLGSKCFFRPFFQHKQYHIQLRLDYTPKGIDSFGNPTLDADIYEEKNGVRAKIPNGKWHNTPPEIDTDMQRYVYRFRFDNLKLDLITNRTVQKDITSQCVVADHLEIKHNGKTVFQS